MLSTIYRARRYSLHGYCRTWYEPCHWLYANLLRRPLRAIIDQWEADGDSAFRSMAAEYRSRERAKLAEWT